VVVERRFPRAVVSCYAVVGLPWEQCGMATWQLIVMAGIFQLSCCRFWYQPTSEVGGGIPISQPGNLSSWVVSWLGKCWCFRASRSHSLSQLFAALPGEELVQILPPLCGSGSLTFCPLSPGFQLRWS
jgi:hypothetical protein